MLWKRATCIERKNDPSEQDVNPCAFVDELGVGQVHPTIAVCEFVQVIKQESSRWIKEHREWFPNFDAWGNGYAAFTYSVAERQRVIEYIKNQKEHHHKATFKEEYEDLLREFGMDPATDLFLKD